MGIKEKIYVESHAYHLKFCNMFSYLQTIFGGQLGSQQLKYITFLSDSTDCFMFLALILLVIAEEDWGESFLAWEYDLTLFLECCCSDLSTWPHLQIPWSFIASTAPRLAATVQALLVELIFDISSWLWIGNEKEVFWFWWCWSVELVFLI